MGNYPEYAIDFDRIVKSKVKKHKVPEFILAMIRKIMHQDFLNDYLTLGYTGMDFCTHCLEYLDIRIELEGTENLDVMKEHLCTFVSNHPLGGADGLALTGIIGQHCGGNIGLMINDFLMNIKQIASLSIPVNKLGTQIRDLPALTRDLYSSQKQLVIFPAGKCSRKIDGIIQDVEWSKSFVKLSVQNDRWIVPIHFIGTNSKRFYRVDRICKLLKIKFNLPMMLLPDELFRSQHKTFKVVIGKPIPPSYFDKTKTHKEWAQEIRAISHSL